MSDIMALNLDDPIIEPSPAEPTPDLFDISDDGLPPFEDEDEPESYPEPLRLRVPKPIVWGFIILFSLALIAMGIWGLAHSTLTYGMTSVGSATTGRLTQIYARLASAGAPEAALRRLAVATQPGVNIGDALEALVDADKALEPMSDNAEIASARQELHAILVNLSSMRYGGQVPAPTPHLEKTWLAFPVSTP